ncbi:DNA glycosylase AlkZ-like family protein [Nocardioides panaciterrulae]|uniref:Winged helix-turn-helix domain-containing protein n=1 Tax=Nocardioides panaciterrulae TaxID=661492 RepID=A0A7Y9JAT4_9ACTN|nr:crosslink repair DNA glycosylase YcaQ family protein [Nocardioides panaciterrulae]NYD41693.1 hypothetical protein [Nocardioides panaciterrulae]
MAVAHELSRTEARRVAVRAQLLTADRPTDLLELVEHLTILQLDQTNAVAPSADLVAWSRLGSAFRPADLEDALAEGRLVELDGRARPAGDIALFRAEMAAWPGVGEPKEWEHHVAQWVRDNDECRRDILEALRADGPLPARALPDTCVRPWRSSGWNDHKNVQRLLAMMVQRGEVAAAGREGRDRLWDLADRIYPDDPVVPLEEAARQRAARRLRSLGIARARAAVTPGEPNDVGEAGEPAVVEGLPGKWRVDPAYLDTAPFAGRTALLSPLDRLVFDRKRMTEIFAFDYQLEMYKPVEKRRWGYWAMPILHGDRLVGKLDASADRPEGAFVVHAVHEDEPFDAATTAAVRAEIEELARWLDLDLVMPPGTSGG